MKRLSIGLIALVACSGCYASYVADGDGPPPRPRDCIALRDQGIVDALSEDSERWIRPDADLGGCFDVGGPPVFREEFVFCNSGPAVRYEVLLDGREGDPALSLGDPYLVVYEGGGVPEDTTMCIGGNDDDGVGRDARFELVVPEDGVITVVATSFVEETGTFQLRLRPR